MNCFALLQIRAARVHMHKARFMWSFVTTATATDTTDGTAAVTLRHHPGTPALDSPIQIVCDINIYSSYTTPPALLD